MMYVIINNIIREILATTLVRERCQALSFDTNKIRLVNEPDSRMLGRCVGIRRTEILINYGHKKLRDLYNKDPLAAKARLTKTVLHELRHWEQFNWLYSYFGEWEKVNTFMLHLYNLHGYKNCPMEVDAREAGEGIRKSIRLFLNKVLQDHKDFVRTLL